MLAHNVFFTLKDSSEPAEERLIAACNKYLAPDPGVVNFWCGRLVPDLDRPVNDRDFHVALHVVFKDRAAHDAYQLAEHHQQFIDENKDNWSAVRVFDSDV